MRQQTKGGKGACNYHNINLGAIKLQTSMVYLESVRLLEMPAAIYMHG